MMNQRSTKEIIEELKGCLYQLIDIKHAYDRYDGVEERCRDYDFAEVVLDLLAEEHDYVYRHIEVLIEKLLPRKSESLWRRFKYGSAKVRIITRQIVRDSFYKHTIFIHGFDTECSEFYCLIKLFEDVGKKTRDLFKENLFGYSTDYGLSYDKVLYLEV